MVRRYHRPLLRVAKSRLGRTEWAEDVVQETFLAAFKSLHTYDSQYSFRTWIWTILLNQCRRAFAKQARRESKSTQQTTSEGWEQQLLDPDPRGPGSATEFNEQARRLQDILEQLNPDLADSLRLRFYGGLKFQEIADSMGCSLSTAKNRVKQGLMQMAERLPASDAPGSARASSQNQSKSSTGENPS